MCSSDLSVSSAIAAAPRQILSQYERIKIHFANAENHIRNVDYVIAKQEIEEILKIDYRNKEALELLSRINTLLRILE